MLAHDERNRAQGWLASCEANLTLPRLSSFDLVHAALPSMPQCFSMYSVSYSNVDRLLISFAAALCL